MPALWYSGEAKLPLGAATRVPAGSLDAGRVRVQSARHRNHRPEGYARMTSARKAAANRQNALKSTGPKTPDGKAAVRLNALRHGLLSEDILLPGEDEEALRELAEGLRAELQPVGDVQASSWTGSPPSSGGSGAWVAWRLGYLPMSSSRNSPTGRSGRLVPRSQRCPTLWLLPTPA